MQPKCPSTSANTSTSSSNLPATTLHIPPERFKEVCIRGRGNDELSNEITAVLAYLFDPERESSRSKPDLDNLKLYLTGGTTYDSFKHKSDLFFFRIFYYF